LFILLYYNTLKTYLQISNPSR